MPHLTADFRGLIMICPSCGQNNRLAYNKLANRARCGQCKAELPLPARVVEIDAAEVFVALIRCSAVPVFVDFWAPWCGPCRMVAPEIEKLAELSAGEAIIAKVNTEVLPEIASQFRIQSIPTFAVFDRSGEAARTSGAMPASRLREFISESTR